MKVPRRLLFSMLFIIVACKIRSVEALATPTTVEPRRVVVVGGGVGGLAVAARIASSASSSSYRSSPPCEVVLLEKNTEDMVGGRCGSFDVSVKNLGTFRHERGTSLLLLRDEYEALFRDCALSSAEDFGLRMEQCNPAYQVVFDDGDTIELGFSRGQIPGTDAKAADGVGVDEAELKSRAKMNTFEPGGAKKWDAYMRSTSAFLDCGLPNFIEERLDLKSFPAFLKEALRDGGKSWPLKPHSDVLDAVFESDKMRALASFQDLYVGLEPYQNNTQIFGGVMRKTAPAVFGLLAALELHPTNEKAGVFAPIGGFRAVGTAFRRLAEDTGVIFKFQKTVTKVSGRGVHMIDTGDNGGGESVFLPADLIVINADLPFSTESLLKEEKNTKSAATGKYDWDDGFDFSSGVVAFHWSIDKRLDELNTHNVFLAASNRQQAEASWRVLRDISSNGQEIEPFNFYVHRAGKTDPSAAPTGCDSVMILVPCKSLSRNEEFSNLPREAAILKYKEQFSERYISNIRGSVMRRLMVLEGLADLQNHIVDEVIDTPGTYADFYNLGAGVPFGLSHGFGQLSITRPGSGSSNIENVLFVGASSRPGNGVPLVLLGAKAVADKALKKWTCFVRSI